MTLHFNNQLSVSEGFSTVYFRSTQVSVLNNLHILLLILRDHLAPSLQVSLGSLWLLLLLNTTSFIFSGSVTQGLGCRVRGPVIKSGRKEMSHNEKTWRTMLYCFYCYQNSCRGYCQLLFSRAAHSLQVFYRPSVHTLTKKGKVDIRKSGFGISATLLLWTSCSPHQFWLRS